MFFWLFLGIIGYLFYHFYWKRRNLPPGPLPLPLVGNLLTIKNMEPGYAAYQMWKKQFGSVYTYWLGPEAIVAINDYPTIKETFIKDGEGYQDKFQVMEGADWFRGGPYGVVDTNGAMWREHRRFALHQFRDFGLGTNLMEQRVMLEVEALCNELTTSKNQPIEVQENLDRAVGSVINQLLFGYRFDDETLGEFLELKHLISELMKDFVQVETFLLVMYPLMKHVPYLKGFYKKMLRDRDELFGFFARQIAEHEKSTDYNNEDATDYVYAYLKEKKRREDEGDTYTFSNIQLQNLCFDLWVAGMETTSNTLAWAVIYILHNPEVQKKVHAELDEVIGSSRQVQMSDKPILPYLNAVINEVQRMANLLPQNLVHQTTRPVKIGNYQVDQGVSVIAQISSVLYDPEIFPDPDSFKPERFLDSSGKLLKVEELVPFSIGKRQCLGESLARMELFLFTANMLNRFKFSCDSLPSADKVAGITMQPKRFKCNAQTRH